MPKALLFPGQGSQKIGMGKDLYDHSPMVRALFEEADDAVGKSLSDICFNGPKEALTQTENTQPALLLCSIAALKVIEQEHDISFDLVAGHSLGEWTACVATGAISFADAIVAVYHRGKAMQEAVPVGEGAMAAIIGLSSDDVTTLCHLHAGDYRVCMPANFNGGGQIVISGHKDAVEQVVAIAKEKKARAIMLPVSAPFHCSLMSSAADVVEKTLASIPCHDSSVPIVVNVTATPITEAAQIKQSLIKQVTAPVLWEQTIQEFVQSKIDSVLEIGTGNVLTGLVRRIAPEMTRHNAGTIEQISSLSF